MPAVDQTSTSANDLQNRSGGGKAGALNTSESDLWGKPNEQPK
ncbi:hypothetical protein ACF5W4_13410 [Bacillota bacterium Lsc_1132]